MRRRHQFICAWLLILLGILSIVASPSVGLTLGARPTPVSIDTVRETTGATVVHTSVMLIPAYDMWLMSGMMFGGVMTMFAGVHWSVLLRR